MKPMSTMNVIPFIDVMLVLLAIVLTTATFVAQGKIPVNLPSASQAEPLDMRQTVEITVARNGEIHVDRDPVSVELFTRRMAELDRETRVSLRVDERAAFAHFVVIIDQLKARQLRNVSIVTERAGRR